MEKAAANAAVAKERIERIKRGENVEGGLGKPLSLEECHCIMREAGLTAGDIKHACRCTGSAMRSDSRRCARRYTKPGTAPSATSCASFIAASRPSSESGNVMPSVFEVLRLSTSSTLTPTGQNQPASRP